jgi:type I restriction enzyme S subunit
MIAELRPYAEYKQSGLPWLGQLPTHWDSERAKWLFTKMERPVRDEDEVVTCFRDGMVTLRKNRRLRGFTEATVFSGYQGIRRGDLVIHGMDAFAGAIGVSDSDGKGTPVYNVCQPKPGVDARYYAHLIRQMSQSQWILALAKGIRERSTDFRFEMFGNQRVPIPPVSEQAKIVRFLDWANGRLERAIRAKRKVIALLNEQKQAIIHRAVTRGLDSSVSLRPSGVAWLGDIPQHWDVRRAKVLLKEIDVRSSTGTESLLRVSQYTGVTPRKSDDSTGMPRANSLIGYKVVGEGDLVINIMIAWNGSLGASRYAGVVSPAYCVYRFREDCNPWYFHHLLRSKHYGARIKQASTGVIESRLRLYSDALGCIEMITPPLLEQSIIVEAIDRETVGLNETSERLEREIELLREYRTRLVADVVTGKLDVREAACLMPDEAPLETNPDDFDLGDEADTADEDAEE